MSFPVNDKERKDWWIFRVQHESENSVFEGLWEACRAEDTRTIELVFNDPELSVSLSKHHEKLFNTIICYGSPNMMFRVFWFFNIHAPTYGFFYPFANQQRSEKARSSLEIVEALQFLAETCINELDKQLPYELTNVVFDYSGFVPFVDIIKDASVDKFGFYKKFLASKFHKRGNIQAMAWLATHALKTSNIVLLRLLWIDGFENQFCKLKALDDYKELDILVRFESCIEDFQMQHILPFLVANYDELQAHGFLKNISSKLSFQLFRAITQRN